MSKLSRRRIAITMGDPAGVGPEIIAKALAHQSFSKSADIVVIGNQDVYARYAEEKDFPDFIHLEEDSLKKLRPGRPSAKTGWAALLYLRQAVELLAQDKVDALVTAPLSKESICEHHSGFIGHTEFLADAFGCSHVDMMFVAPLMKTTIVTRHIPLAQVSRAMTQQSILDTLVLSDQALKQIFSIKRPRIAVCGLNPHAGEHGLIGQEDDRIIVPAIKAARHKKINVVGPLAADTLFVPQHAKEFDLIVAMYHDQGLIPIKSLYFNQLVNVTVGLPFLRTSPAHGTAFDIAGKGVVDAGSMIESIKLAIKYG